MKVKRGSTRIVILVGKYAVKIPNIVEWKLFLNGLLGNMRERAYWRFQTFPKLCPIVFSIPGGFINIMKRATPLSIEEFNDLNWVLFDRIPCERKLSSYGLLEGKIVVVDYDCRES